MENEKYIITIDGPDCTGKSTLFACTDKNVQIRGIVSNIAYALKYNRDVDELIELYNQNPLNYVVYLLNPNNSTKLEMLYNRLKETTNDNVKIASELKSASKTWNDFGYFEQAINLLKSEYKGKLEIIKASNNDTYDFNKAVDKFVSYDLDELKDVPSIKILETEYDLFEKEAKEISEYKYIVLYKNISPEDLMNKLYNQLDDEYKSLLDYFYDNTSISSSDIYEFLEEKTVESLKEYLDNAELEVEYSATTEVSTSGYVNIPLKEAKKAYCLEDWIYNDSCAIDDICDGLKLNVGDNDIDVSIETVEYR